MKVLSFDRLSAEKGISWGRDHLRRKIKNREFPAPIQMSSRRIAWTEESIDRWLAERPTAASAAE
jgi:predicted DNA-binding transcriptional regulator AlpA